MTNGVKLEIAGPIAVITTLAASQLAAYALANWPTSTVLWYLNLEVFRAVQYSYLNLEIFGGVEHSNLATLATVAQGVLNDQAPPALLIIGIFFALVGFGLICRVRLAVALASNLSLLYSSLLLFGAYIASSPMAVGLRFSTSELGTPALFVAGAVFFVCLISSVMSHRSYWRAIFA
jgi:hypothetical protein